MTEEQLRVLIVDNDPEVCCDHRTNLRKWGYEPVVAEGIGDTLIEDAIEKAHSKCCIVALVDMRLRDDHDKRDISGLSLIPLLKPTRAIVVSGKGDRKTATEALTTYGAVNFAGKEEGPRALKQKIESLLEELCPSINVQWPQSVERETVLQQLELESTDTPHYVLECLLRKVYAVRGEGPAVAQLVLRPLNEHYSTDDDITSLLRSVVLVAQRRGDDGRWFQDEIVKLASERQITAELNAYRNYVSPHIRPTRSARIEDSENASILWRLGAIRYTDVADGNAKPFRIWYRRNTTLTAWLQSSLEHLFQRTLSPWHQENQGERNNRNLYAYYTGVWNTLEEKLADHPKRGKPVFIPDTPIPLTNPIDWVQRNRAYCDFVSYWEALSHGDMHSDNFFVKENGNTYILDYERSGPGHYLRDFVEMEVDILLRLMPLDTVKAPEFYELCIDLLTPHSARMMPVMTTLTRLRAAASPQQTQAWQDLDRAFRMVYTVRNLVHTETSLRSMREYYWALLMNAVLTLTRKAGRPASEESNVYYEDRGLLLAALICERLAGWDESWPSAKWSAVVS